MEAKAAVGGQQADLGVQRVAHLVGDYRLGIVRWWHSRISNGLLEGLHSLVQAAKRRARGYRSTRNYTP